MSELGADISKQEAIKAKELTIHQVFAARTLLQQAQNEIAFVEGEGSEEIYDMIANIYQDNLSDLLDKLKKFRPTGVMFEEAQS